MSKKQPVPAQCYPAGTFICDTCEARVFFVMLALDREQLTEEDRVQIVATSGPVDFSKPAVFYNLPECVTCVCGRVYLPYETPEDLLKLLEES